MLVRLQKIGTRLHGKTAGQAAFARLCEQLYSATPGQVVFLDLAGVRLVNGSWLNSAIAPLLSWASDGENDLYPVMANFPEEWRDELELVGRANGQCFALVEGCEVPIQRLHLVGTLDDALLTTYRSVASLGEATGAELARLLPEVGIQPTAWNNRLRELYERRLLLRRTQGRQQVYTPLAKEVTVDG